MEAEERMAGREEEERKEMEGEGKSIVILRCLPLLPCSEFTHPAVLISRPPLLLPPHLHPSTLSQGAGRRWDYAHNALSKGNGW